MSINRIIKQTKKGERPFIEVVIKIRDHSNNYLICTIVDQLISFILARDIARKDQRRDHVFKLKS